MAGDMTVREAVGHLLADTVNGRRIEVYMQITNGGADMDRLYAVRSRLSRNTMLSVVGDGAHRGHDDGKGMAMKKHHETSLLMLPAGATVGLKKGGSHIMLMAPDEIPAVGSTFPVTLFFEGAGRVTVEVTMAAAGPA